MEKSGSPAIRRLSVEGTIRFVTRWLNWIAAAGLVAAMIVVCINVIGRGFFQSPLKGTVDISSLLGALIIAGAIPYTQVLKGHIRIGLFVDRLPHRVRYITECIMHLIGFALFAVISWQTILFCITTSEVGELSEVMKIPLVPFAAFVSAGCIALTLALLFDAVVAFKKAVWK